MRHAAKVALVALLALGSGAAAAEGIKQRVCYRADVPRSYGPVRSITAHLDGKGVDIQFSEWDTPNTTFLVGASCNESKGRMIHCGVDCDGGTADIALTADGRLSVLAKNLRTLSLGEGSRLLGSLDADGGVLTGLYVLKESNEEECTPEGETYPVALEAGDDTPSVATAEKLLNDLGFLLEKPDNIYSDHTRSAVMQFQTASGLKATGIIDAETARRLVAQAAANGGC